MGRCPRCGQEMEERPSSSPDVPEVIAGALVGGVLVGILSNVWAGAGAIAGARVGYWFYRKRVKKETATTKRRRKQSWSARASYLLKR